MNQIKGLLNQIKGLLNQIKGLLNQIKGLLNQIQGLSKPATSGFIHMMLWLQGNNLMPLRF
ncbi:hypothetical protein DU87_03915 [Methanosarcina mazei]|uniref:Uncharacterized protein n=1 Tax=Methanosarcina mazei TaxID=2209 RepID=A0A0F8PPE7_METMZ|nr:hypothetical protein DU87_03915 [Methanosarcina mazei]